MIKSGINEWNKGYAIEQAYEKFESGELTFERYESVVIDIEEKYKVKKINRSDIFDLVTAKEGKKPNIKSNIAASKWEDYKDLVVSRGFL